MLEPEDQDRLGLGHSARRPSSVSQVLRAIREQVEHGPGSWELEGSPDTDNSDGYRVLLSADRTTRERAYRLANRMYRDHGFVEDGKSAWCVSPYDADPRTLTLLAENRAGQEVATVSLAFEAPAGLPCDEIFRGELDALRARGRRAVEVTRLALVEGQTYSKTLLVSLFNFIYIFARRVQGCDDFVIEVNPRHVNYYRRLLKFEVLGPERPCPRVHGAPAVLLRLDLGVAEREIRRVAGQGAAAGERTLYPYFYPCLEEGVVAEFLRNKHRPMSTQEKNYFGLEPVALPSNLVAAACGAVA